MISATHFHPEVKATLLAIAGSMVLVIGMGYGRFAFTGILAVMMAGQLFTLHQGNLAASANYAGYLLGALLLAKARPTDARLLCFSSVGAAQLAGTGLDKLSFQYHCDTRPGGYV